MTLIIRPAARDDLPAIVTLLAEDTIPIDREDASLPLDPRYIAAFEALDSDPNHMLVAAEYGGRIVGTLQLSFLPGMSFRGMLRGQVESVRIASDMRSHGFGAEMMRWAEATCRARGCQLMQLTSTSTRLAAHRFYERLGWHKTHTGFKLPLGGND